VYSSKKLENQQAITTLKVYKLLQKILKLAKLTSHHNHESLQVVAKKLQDTLFYVHSDFPHFQKLPYNPKILGLQVVCKSLQV
jgi:hypothetical protein